MKVFWRYKGGEFHEIRASYGTLGNDQIGNNGYVSQLNGEGTYVF
jgi:hypothetical protein